MKTVQPMPDHRPASLDDFPRNLGEPLPQVDPKLAKHPNRKPQNAESFRNLTMAVHGLRNPAIGIMYAAECLIEDECEGFTETQRALLHGIVRSTSFMLQMIQEIMDTSKIACGELNVNRQPSDLVSLAKAAFAMNERDAECKRIRLELSLEGNAFAIDLDSPKIIQVMDNLLQNAIKFSPDGTRIETTIGIKENVASISVRDEGPGIPDSERVLIFQRFYQSGRRTATGGSGLGLAICQRIVRAHGGTITVASKVGNGSIFTVNLPVTTNLGANRNGLFGKEPRRRTSIAAT